MDTQQTELEGLDRARTIHVAALNDGDANAWAACFDTDAVQMPPNQPPNVGTQRIQQWTQASWVRSARSSQSSHTTSSSQAPTGPSNAAPTKSASHPEPAATRSATAASTSPSTGDSRATTG